MGQEHKERQLFYVEDESIRSSLDAILECYEDGSDQMNAFLGAVQAVLLAADKRTVLSEGQSARTRLDSILDHYEPGSREMNALLQAIEAAARLFTIIRGQASELLASSDQGLIGVMGYIKAQLAGLYDDEGSNRLHCVNESSPIKLEKDNFNIIKKHATEMPKDYGFQGEVCYLVCLVSVGGELYHLYINKAKNLPNFYEKQVS